MSQHNENSRVKIPAILHLMRLGYGYLSLKNNDWDSQTNIFRKFLLTAYAVSILSCQPMMPSVS